MGRYNLTKKEALEKTIEMWEDIKKRKIKNKTQYAKDLDIPCGCYLCAYALVMIEDFNDFYNAQNLANQINKCTFCPITNWSLNGDTARKCTQVNSIYMKHFIAYERADDIIELCKRELQKCIN